MKKQKTDTEDRKRSITGERKKGGRSNQAKGVTFIIGGTNLVEKSTDGWKEEGDAVTRQRVFFLIGRETKTGLTQIQMKGGMYKDTEQIKTSDIEA